MLSPTGNVAQEVEAPQNGGEINWNSMPDFLLKPRRSSASRLPSLATLVSNESRLLRFSNSLFSLEPVLISMVPVVFK